MASKRCADSASSQYWWRHLPLLLSNYGSIRHKLLLPSAIRPNLILRWGLAQRGMASTEQPADQLERWDLPYDNGTHVVILWKNDKRVSGRNVSMYHVDVRTSVPVLNFFVGQFGGFPQDVCAPGGSKARNQVNVEGSAGACSPYGLEDHHVQRRTAFEIPPTLRKLAKWDIDVRVRGYGAHTPIGRPKEEVRTTWWCKVYRRPRDESDQPATAYRGGSSRRTTRADASHGEHGQGELLTLPRRLLAPRLRAFGDRAKRLLNR